MSPSRIGAGRLDWLPGAAALLAAASCYGLLLLTATLSLFGTTLPIHEGAWAAIVAFFALLALAGVLLGYRRHGALGPVVLAVTGAGLVTAVMLAHYNWIGELAGFAALAGAATWDWRLRRARRQREELNA